MGSRFDRVDEFRGGRGGGGRGGFFRGGPPDDFRREPWNGRGRGGVPLERDDYERARFRDLPGLGREGPGGREKGLSRSDFAAERARVCTNTPFTHSSCLHVVRLPFSCDPGSANHTDKLIQNSPCLAASWLQCRSGIMPYARRLLRNDCGWSAR